jgi:hypothetical protein
MMRYLLAVSMFFNLTATAQVTRVDNFDGCHLKKLPFTYLPVKGAFACIYRSKVSVFLDFASWKNYNEECHDNNEPIDFYKYGVWQHETSGDCNAIFTHELFLDTSAKKMIWLEHIWDGGCRGMVFKEYRIMFPKPPAGYTFEQKAILEMHWRNYNR